jgi:hypothetical protein
MPKNTTEPQLLSERFGALAVATRAPPDRRQLSAAERERVVEAWRAREIVAAWLRTPSAPVQ